MRTLLLHGFAALLQDASTPEERTITVSDGGLATIREVRSAQLSAGRSALRVFDVAPLLLPETVAMRALQSPELVRLDEQSAWFEVLSVEKALESLAGRPVKLKRFHESTVESLTGRLLFPPVVGSPAGELRLPLYLEDAEGDIRLLDDAEIVLDSLPAGDWNRMRLDWKLDCQRADRYRIELLYATRGLEWHADWQLRVGSDGQHGDLAVTVTIVNGCGMALPGARFAVQDAETLHPVSDGATLEREGKLQAVIAQVRDVRLTATPTFPVARALPGRPAPPHDHGLRPLLRRFDLDPAAAAKIGRALPGGDARTVVLDARNRPFATSSFRVAPTRGDGLPPFFAEPLAGLRATAVHAPGDGDESWLVVVSSTRAEPSDVDIAVPLAEHERLVPAEPAPHSRVIGWGLARLHVPARATAALKLLVKSP